MNDIAKVRYFFNFFIEFVLIFLIIHLQGFARSTYGLTADIEHVVTGLEIVSGTSLYGYKEGDVTQNFFKIYVVSPRIITGCML